jgi:ABC-type glycerol-3-phosphate transport system permease component
VSTRSEPLAGLAAFATSHAQRIVTYMVLVIGTLMLLFPLVWSFSAALKSNNEIFVIPVEWIPRQFQWQNFILPFQEKPFVKYFGNSLLAAGSSVLVTLVIASLAGYSLAKYNYFGKRIAFLAILSTMMLPVQVLLVPLYLVVRDMGWLDTYQGLILPQAVNAFSIFLMRQHILSIPDDYIEAARLDGSSELGILWRVVLPMSKASLSAVAIFTFLGSWDSYVWPLVVVSRDELRTLPLGLSLFFSEYSSNYNQALAAALVIMLPVLITFIILQRQFVEGLSQSGLK